MLANNENFECSGFCSPCELNSRPEPVIPPPLDQSVASGGAVAFSAIAFHSNGFDILRLVQVQLNLLKKQIGVFSEDLQNGTDIIVSQDDS